MLIDVFKHMGGAILVPITQGASGRNVAYPQMIELTLRHAKPADYLPKTGAARNHAVKHAYKVLITAQMLIITVGFTVPYYARKLLTAAK